MTLSSTLPTLSGKRCVEWNTAADGSGTKYSPGGIYSANANVTLYAKWVNNTVPAVGSYVSYNGGGYYIEDWCIFRNTTGAWEIFPTSGVRTLTLSGASGYANAVKTLNDAAAQYANAAYAVGGRSVGSTSSSVGQINTSTYPLNHGVSGLPYTDTYYTSDVTIINNNSSLFRPVSGSGIDATYWLASRDTTAGSNLTSFFVRNLIYTGGINSDTLYRAGSTTGGLSATRALRPVIQLKPNVYIASGSGTKANPYILAVGGPASTGPYTVSLFAALPSSAVTSDTLTVSPIKASTGGTVTLTAPALGGTTPLPTGGYVTINFNKWVSDNSTWTIANPNSATTTATAGTGDVTFTATYTASGY